MKCTMCDNAGRPAKVVFEGKDLVSTLCVIHDALCLTCFIEDDYTILAEILRDQSPVELSLEDAKGPAKLLVGIRMSAYGFTAETIRNFGSMVKEMPDNADEIDMGLRVLTFMHENEMGRF